MQQSLESGNYWEAMVLVGGYFNKQPVFQQDLPDGGGIVLFEAATLTEGQTPKAKRWRTDKCTSLMRDLCTE